MKHAITLLAIIAIVLFGLLGFCETVRRGLAQVVDHPHSDYRSGGHIAGVDLYKKSTPHPLKQDYPEIFSTEAVVVSFGADWCGWCKVQARALHGPAEKYHILHVQIDEIDSQGTRVPTRWGRLAKSLNLGDSIPVTVVLARGEVTAIFTGYTPWAEMKDQAEKAKKNEHYERATCF